MGGGGQHDEGAAFRIEDGLPCIGEHSFPAACTVVEQDPWAGFFLMFENGWAAGFLWRVDGQRPCGDTANVFGCWQNDWPEVDLGYGYWGGGPREPCGPEEAIAFIEQVAIRPTPWAAFPVGEGREDLLQRLGAAAVRRHYDDQ
jgi:hypothetical protein